MNVTQIDQFYAKNKKIIKKFKFVLSTFNSICRLELSTYMNICFIQNSVVYLYKMALNMNSTNVKSKCD